MSYTTFKFSNLRVSNITYSNNQFATLEANWAKGKGYTTGVGSSAALWLHRPAFKVEFEVQNTGDVAGTEARSWIYTVLFGR